MMELVTQAGAASSASLPRCEVCAIRVVEDQGAHGGLRLHHHSFGQLDADLLGADVHLLDGHGLDRAEGPEIQAGRQTVGAVAQNVRAAGCGAELC